LKPVTTKLNELPAKTSEWERLACVMMGSPSALSGCELKKAGKKYQAIEKYTNNGTAIIENRIMGFIFRS
jgi:hypothetical protein